MASWMKWLGAVLIGGVALSAIARTVPDLPERHVRTEDPLTLEARRVQSEIWAAERAWREQARADSLLPLLPAQPGTSIGLSPALPAPVRDTTIAAVDRELAALGQPRARMGVFVLDQHYGAYPGMRVSRTPWGLGREVYAGVDSAGAYCAVVALGFMAERGELMADGFQSIRDDGRAGYLGPCRFYGRYGAPGVALSQWLSDGGFWFGETPGPSWPSDFRAQSRGRWVFWSEHVLRARACAAGRSDLCSEMLDLTRRDPARTAAARAAQLPGIERYQADAHRMLLSDVESAFGPERFERFWTSDEEVPVAFASAFGIEITDWLAAWGEAKYGPQQLGARVGAGSILLSLLTVMAAGGVAAAVAARRRI